MQSGPSSTFTDAELYRRGAETLVASWEVDARGARGASVERSPGVAAAVFPQEPERTFFNNALLDRGLAAPARAHAVEAMEAAYEAAGVVRFAAWAHESDRRLQAELERRGYVLVETTRAMGMALDDLRVPRPEIELGAPDWIACLRVLGLPDEFLAGADRAAYRILVARLAGEDVAAAMALDHDDDCGIYNVGTLDRARRRGLATALTALHVHEALARGCRTASLQSTETAERVYATVGFRDLGRILEYTPAHAVSHGT